MCSMAKIAQKSIAEAPVIQEHLVMEDTQDDLDEHLGLLGLLICVAAVLASSAAFMVDLATASLASWRTEHLIDFGLPKSAASMLWNLFFATAARLCSGLAEGSAGSGLPEIKCMIKGRRLPHVLRPRVVIAICLGLTCGLAAQLPLGKEGPYVHIASVFGTWLFKLGAFRALSKRCRQVVLVSMVSVGSGATLGAPIGGALMGIEFVMPVLLDMHSYGLCFVSGVLGSVCHYLWMQTLTDPSKIRPLLSTDVPSDSFALLGFSWRCVILAVVCGGFAALFVHTQDAVGRIFRWLKAPRHGTRALEAPLAGSQPATRRGPPAIVIDLALMWVVTAANTWFSSVMPLNGCAAPAIINKFFSEEGPGRDDMGPLLDGMGRTAALAFFFVCRFVLTSIAIKLPIPCGCIAPNLVLGAALGGLLADLLGNGDCMECRSWFAIVGAACFTASTCHTFSIVVAVFELLALPSLILPLSMCTIIAQWIAGMLGPSIFDSISRFKRLPCLSSLSMDPRMHKRVDSRMRGPSGYMLPTKMTVAKFFEFAANLKNDKSAPNQVGIALRCGERDVLVGAIPIHGLDRLCEGLRSFEPHDVVEILQTAAENGLLESTIQVPPGASLARAYNTCQMHAMDNDAYFVVDAGQIVGVLTEGDILFD